MGILISGDRLWAFDSIQTRAARAASGFSSLGVGRGDLIALYLRNDVSFFEASLAAGLIGAYPTPLNWHCTEAEAHYLFENSGAKAIVIHADLAKSIRFALPIDVPKFLVVTPPAIARTYGISEEACIVPPSETDWSCWLEKFEPYRGPAVAAPGTIIYTSGTTGRPKGVRRLPPTAEQIAASRAIVTRAVGFDEYLSDPSQIVTVICGPMYHSAPNTYGTLAATLGAKVILQPRFDPEDLLRLIEVHRVTHIHMVPIMFIRLLKLPDEVKRKYDLSSLKFIVHAAAPCPVAVKQAMIAWWGPIVHEYFGSTETGIVASCTPAEWLRHPGTVGRAIPETILRIVDAQGRPLPVGEIGEVVALTPTIADFTYHGDDAKRQSDAKAGLIAPGDIGYLDPDGFLYLCDRAKDMIISGGVNIYPAEIEAELLRMPGVADCGVFGIPEEEFGEAVCAVIETQRGAELTAQEVIAYLRERISGYKLPKRVEFHTKLPREDSGKIFKRKLREPYWAETNRRI